MNPQREAPTMTTDLPQAAIGAAKRAVIMLYGRDPDDPANQDHDVRVILKAAAPHIAAEAAAAERERIALALLGCLDCGRIHTPHPATFRHKGEPLEHQSWAAPDGHAYRPPHLTRQQIAAAISPPQETRND